MKRKTKVTKIIYKQVKATSEEVQRRMERAYDILFKETIKMMEKSSDPAHIAFLKKFPYFKE